MYFLQIVVRIGLFFYDNRNESQSEGKVVPCITYNVWATRSLTFRHKNTSYDLLLPTWSVHYLFSLLWIPTKPRWFHLLLDKNPTKQRIIVDLGEIFESTSCTKWSHLKNFSSVATNKYNQWVSSDRSTHSSATSHLPIK